MELFNGDCLEILPKIAAKSVNAIICDPPYPEINREYGRMPADEWHLMMHKVVQESRRILKDDGSAAFLLQPNSAKVGQMRPWLWEFIVWAMHEWNMVQDVYWFNNAAMPNVHSQRKYGLMRPAVKHLVWLGSPDCFRNQDNILKEVAKQPKKSNHKLIYSPSGYTIRHDRAYSVPNERGGATPFNVITLTNTYKPTSAAKLGHGAGTPYDLMYKLVRYLTRPGDTVLDPFSGVGTTGAVCLNENRAYIGIEKYQKYHDIAVSELSQKKPASA
jgi:site-specific DNA-methyltransferase (cytosine-N4-specific)